MRKSCFVLVYVLLLLGTGLAEPSYVGPRTVVWELAPGKTPMLLPQKQYLRIPELRTEAVEGGYRFDLDSGQPLIIRRLQNGFSIEAEGTTQLFGLGEQFLPHRTGQSDGDWLGEVRFPGGSIDDPNPHLYGNQMVSLLGGAVGNNQFPILYGYRPGGSSFAIFLDNAQRQRWDFSSEPWKVRYSGGGARLVVSLDADLSALRRRYMSWVGRPPVPPQKAFGLWVSEYGFENWAELDDKLNSLQAAGFPLDGFVLDLQWFGGIATESEKSAMGSLTFDQKNFPNPKRKIEALQREGVGILLIEEAYIAKGLEEHQRLAEQNFLVRADDGDPLYINSTPWWGLGGMLDYTNKEASAFWHRLKRVPLVDLGVVGHWTDLGEPEMYLEKDEKGETRTGHYAIGTEAEAHNLFNFLWSESIFEGYTKFHPQKRPFSVSRSGTSGSQRFGVAMWSGDIGTNYASLATHFNVQSHMSWSGIDYFGSDIGGFYRRAFKGSAEEFDELYTRWFGAACFTDVPIRPHTMNLGNKFETAPDREGHVASNLANIQERYSLLPYYYSLAYRAHFNGDPLVAPLAYWYPQRDQWLDWNEDGNQKLIGPDLMVAVEDQPKTRVKEVFLPAGDWYDFRNGTRYASSQSRVREFSLFDSEARFRPPLLARAGALVPLASEPGTLHFRCFSGAPGRFSLFEDDGRSTAYLKGDYRETVVRQNRIQGGWELVVAGSRGSFEGAEPFRRVKLELVGVPKLKKVTCNGQEIGFRQHPWGVELEKRVEPKWPQVFRFNFDPAATLL